MEWTEEEKKAKEAHLTNKVNEVIQQLRDNGLSTKGISDSYHTFGELYHHRAMLFKQICHHHRARAWKSWLHDDGTMFDGMFIVGISTPAGQYTYHYHASYWDEFDVSPIAKAPEYDGHKPEDIDRLDSLHEDEGGMNHG